MPQDVINVIPKYESGNKNVLNYLYDPQHTAGGYWQITDTNWKEYAPKVGIDTSKYPTAISAERDDQQKVAEHLLYQTPKGIRNWTDYNPKLKAALEKGEMADQQPNYANMSDEELLKLVMKDPELSKRIVTQNVDTKKTDTNKRTLTVKSPEAGWSKFLRQWGESKTPEDFMHGGMIIPGLKQVARGITEPGGDWRSHTADVIEGGGRAMAPVGIGALLGLTGGAGAGALAEGGGAADVIGAGLRAAWPFAKGAIGGTVGYGAGQLASQDPQTRRVASDVLGLAGSAYGPRASLPKGRVAPAVVRGLGNILPIPGSKHVGDFMADWMLGKSEPPVKTSPTSKVGPTSKVEPPKPPTRAESTEMLRTNTIDENRFLEHEAARNSDPQTAKEHLATAKAKIAEEAPPPPQPTATVIPEEKMPPPINITGTPTEVTLPPNLKIKTTTPVPGPTPQGTGMPQPPPAPVPPGSLGTVGPLPPNVQGPQLQGPAIGGTPPGPQLTPNLPVAPPIQPPPPIPGTAGPQGLVSAPPVPQTSGPPQSMTPIGKQLTPTMPAALSRADRIEAILKLATEWDKVPPRATNKAAMGKWTKELGFEMSPSEAAEAIDTFKTRKVATGARSREP